MLGLIISTRFDLRDRNIASELGQGQLCTGNFSVACISSGETKRKDS